MILVMKKWCAFAMFIVAFTGLADGKERPTWEEALQSYMEQVADALAVPGAVAVVVTHDGVTVLTHGIRCVDRADPVTPQTSFGLGSLTKAFTATAAAVLVGDGILDWDAKASDLIPKLVLADPVATERLTLRDLLAHRSGLASHDILLLNIDAPQAWILPRLALVEPTYELRDRFLYSDLGYALAGEMIGRAAGSSWAEVVSERLLGPLGMSSTSVGSPPDRKANVARGHRRWRGSLTTIAPLSLSAGAPGNGLYSTGNDVVRWLALLLGSGEVDRQQIVETMSLQETWTPQVAIRTTPSELRAYGLGWYLSLWRGRAVRWHQGGGLGFTSQTRVFPAEEVAVAVLCNRMASGLPDLVATRAAELIFEEPHEDLLERAVQLTTTIENHRTAAAESIRSEKNPGAPPSLDLDAYIGCYEHPALGHLEVDAEGAALVATYHGIELPIEHVHDDFFFMSSIYTDDIFASFNVTGDTVPSVAVTLDAPPPGRIFTRVARSCSEDLPNSGS
jgi:CubicO group peptidase (beta-lactamase class C family)